MEFLDLICPPSCCRCPTPILPGSLRLSDALTLTLQQDLSFELGNTSEDIQHQPPIRRSGVDGHSQNPKGYSLGFQGRDDLQQVGYGSGKPIQLGHDQCVPFPSEVDCSFQFHPVGNIHRGNPFREDFLAPCLRQITDLSFEAGHLFGR
jgi:hypothetical protein